MNAVMEKSVIAMDVVQKWKKENIIVLNVKKKKLLKKNLLIENN